MTHTSDHAAHADCAYADVLCPQGLDHMSCNSFNYRVALRTHASEYTVAGGPAGMAADMMARTAMFGYLHTVPRYRLKVGVGGPDLSVDTLFYGALLDGRSWGTPLPTARAARESRIRSYSAVLCDGIPGTMFSSR